MYRPRRPDKALISRVKASFACDHSALKSRQNCWSGDRAGIPSQTLGRYNAAGKPANQNMPFGWAVKVRTATVLVCGAAVLSAAAAMYYFRIWPAELLLPTQPAAVAGASAAGPRPGTPVPVKVAAAVVEDVPIYLTGIGTVQAYNTVNVQSRVDGEITQILFAEGQDVKRATRWCIIDPRPYQAQLEQQIADRCKKDQALLDGAVARYAPLRRAGAEGFRARRQQVDQQHALVEQYKRPGQHRRGADRLRADPTRLHHHPRADRRPRRHPADRPGQLRARHRHRRSW